MDVIEVASQTSSASDENESAQPQHAISADDVNSPEREEDENLPRIQSSDPVFSVDDDDDDDDDQVDFASTANEVIIKVQERLGNQVLGNSSSDMLHKRK